MSLLKTPAELKKHFSGTDADFKINSLQSFIDDAEKDVLIPWIGQEIYDVIHTAYNADPTTIAGKTAALLDYLQKAVTHLAFLLSADSGSFRISDSGFYVVVTNNNKPISDKKMTAFRRGRRESGYNALEQAINYLEANINDAAFAVYKASDSHLQHRAYFINSGVEFTRYCKKAANSAYLFNQLTDALSLAERKHIKPVLGNAFFAGLKARIIAGTLSVAEKALMPYINRALANFTMAGGLQGLQVEIDGEQIYISSSPAYGNSENVESKTAASPIQISALVKSATDAGNYELDELEEYLLDHAVDFESYIAPEISEDFNINDPNAPTYFV